MPIPELTFDELAAKYCERQVSEPSDLKLILLQQQEKYQPFGFMLLECAVMDSSHFSSLTILPYGPNNTFKEVPDHPVSPRGLASDTSVVIGILKASELKERR